MLNLFDKKIKFLSFGVYFLIIIILIYLICNFNNNSLSDIDHTNIPEIKNSKKD